ncbi:hypothetical protein GMSM_03890 [Geomonas sp. Red276]
MKASPIISSLLLHLAVISLVVLCAASPPRPLSAVPPVYLDLSPAAPRLESEQSPQAPPGAGVSSLDSQAPLPRPGAPGERSHLSSSAPPVEGRQVAASAPSVDGPPLAASPPLAAASAESSASISPQPSAGLFPQASAQPSARRAAQAAPQWSQAFARAAYQQQGMFRSRSYSDVASLAVRKIVEGRVPIDTRRELDGVQAEVVADYPEEAPAIEVTSGNAILVRALRDPVAWRELPSPSQYRLPYRQVAFLVRFDRGTVHVGLTSR